MEENLYQKYPGIQQNSSADIWNYRYELLERDGYFLIENVLDSKTISKISELLDNIWTKQINQYGADFLQKIGDYGQIRGLILEDQEFLKLIVNPTIDKVVQDVLGEAAILHLQNGIVSHPNRFHNQAKYHKDFAKDFISSKLLSLNVFVLIDEFTEITGGTWLIPGSHRFETMPSDKYLEEHAIQLKGKPGSILFFDSLLWHKGGTNHSKNPRRAINHQFTRAFIKQQLNYPNIIKGHIDIETKIAQRLGCWSIPPASVGEYRVSDPKLRTYRSGQG